MSTNPPNPSGFDGGSGNFFQGDRNGEDPPQPPDKEINKNKNKNSTIPSFFAVAPANDQVVSPPADTTSPSPSPALVPPVANESNPTDMEEDDISDDATVVTSGTGRSRPATPIGQPLVREITLKFLMQSTSNLATPIVASQFLHLLHAITNVDAPNTNQILDQYSKPLTDFGLDTVAKFEEFLPIDTIPAKPDYKKLASYWIIFRVRTQLTLPAIRKNSLVSNVILETKGRLSSYPWPTDDRDIVSIGFMVGAIPKYQTSASFEKEVKTTIAQACKTKRIPKFKCVSSRISAQWQGRFPVTCQAFDVQVRRQDTKKFTQLVYKAFPADTDPTIMLYHNRYDNPNLFAGAVFLQSKYQNDHRIVAINGIPDTHMFGFETLLHREFSPQILKILPTNLTDQKNPTLQPIGRWNILCTKSNFVELAKELHVRLPGLFSEFLQSAGRTLPDGAEPVTVASKFPGKPTADGDSTIGTDDSGRDSHGSKWTARMADSNVEAEIPKEVVRYFTPPQTTLRNFPSQPRSWAQIANPTETVPQSHPQQKIQAPPPAPDPLTEQLYSTILQLQQKLDRMEVKFDSKTEASTPPSQTPSPQSTSLAPPPAPDPQTNRLESVISLLITRMDKLEAKLVEQEDSRDAALEEKLEAKLDAHLQVQSQQMAALTSLIQQHHNKDSNSSPYRKRTKSDKYLESQPSPRPDGTSDKEGILDEVMKDDSI